MADKYTVEQMERRLAKGFILKDGYIDLEAYDMLTQAAQMMREREAVKVTDGDVERACHAAAMRADEATFPDAYGDEEVADMRNWMRAALESFAARRAAVPDELDSRVVAAFQAVANWAGPNLTAAINQALSTASDATPRAAVPNGWKLVPVEPTDAMMDAGTSKHECAQGDPWYGAPALSDVDCVAIYQAMLAAAPEVTK